MNDPIKDAIQQTRRYWYVDGLTELATGALLVVVGVFFIILGMIVPSTFANWLNGLGLPALILVGGIAGRWAVNRLKERLTYPRTGYVAFRQPRVGLKLLTIVVGMMVAVILAVAIFQLKYTWLVNATPAVMSAIMIALVGQRFGLRRFYWLAGYTLLLSLPLALLQVSDKFVVAIFIGGCGLGFLVSGGLTLRNYLNTTQPASKDLE